MLLPGGVAPRLGSALFISGEAECGGLVNTCGCASTHVSRAAGRAHPLSKLKADGLSLRK